MEIVWKLYCHELMKCEIYIIKCIGYFVCLGLPWSYLWTDFQTKGTYGLLMTQGWLEKYKSFKFWKNFFWKFLKFFPNQKPSLNSLFVWPKNFLSWMPHLSKPKISLLECLFKGKRGPPEAALKRVTLNKYTKVK